MKKEKDKKQKSHLLNGRVQIVANGLSNNETILKEIEKNAELLDAIESAHNRQLDIILSNIIRVMNEIKKVDDVAISGNLEEKLKRLGLRHSKWNQGYRRKKRNCEKVVYSLWNSIKSYSIYH